MNTVQKITNIRVLNPMTQTDAIQDIYLCDGKIITEQNSKQANEIKEIDGTGKWLMPTMFDLCARLREPGQQQH